MFSTTRGAHARAGSRGLTRGLTWSPASSPEAVQFGMRPEHTRFLAFVQESTQTSCIVRWRTPSRLCGDAVAVVGVGAFVASNRTDSESGGTSKVKRTPPPRKNAVIVFGSTGRAGKEVVKALLQAGRTVIAASRAAQPDTDMWAELGVCEGEQESGSGILFFESGVDVTDATTLRKELFQGVTQAVIACGPVQKTDNTGFKDGLTPKDVDADGVANVVKVAAENLPTPQYVTTPVMQAADFGKWVNKDDTIMGGKSSSTISVAEGSRGAAPSCRASGLSGDCMRGTCSRHRAARAPSHALL